MKFPNNLQSAIVFDSRVNVLDAIEQTFSRIMQAKNGILFNIVEAKPGVYYRLFGGGELMITLEYVDNPPDPEVFRQTLGSTVTGIYCPDVRQILMRAKSLILVNVAHGVLGGLDRDPKFEAMFKAIGRVEGASQPEFFARCDMLAMLTRIVCDAAPASLVHWTQSNQLLPPQLFDVLAAAPAPNMLLFHPYLFGKGQDAHGAPLVGIRTFGLRHVLGREVFIEPSGLPWSANAEVILAFLRLATIDNGYVIPNGDTFGPEGGSLSYRCIHHDAPEDDIPLYELVPLRYDEFGFQSDDYVPKDRVIDDLNPPAMVMPKDDGDKSELITEWRKKREMAQGAGGRFEVRARGTAPLPPPSAPSPGAAAGARPVFGRKGLLR